MRSNRESCYSPDISSQVKCYDSALEQATNTSFHRSLQPLSQSTLHYIRAGSKVKVAPVF